MYQNGNPMYLRDNHKSGLKKNEMVTIIRSKKRRHRTYVDVVDANGHSVLGLSVKFLRRRPRH